MKPDSKNKEEKIRLCHQNFKKLGLFTELRLVKNKPYWKFSLKLNQDIEKNRKWIEANWDEKVKKSKFLVNKATSILEGKGSTNIDSKKSSSKLTIASVEDVLDWGWDGKDLLEKLIQLDYQTISGLTDENEGHIEQWAPVFIDHPDTWRLLIDGSEIIVGYWHFAPLFDDEYKLAKQGILLDSEITCDKVCHLELPGFYNIYFVLFTILPNYRGVHNFRLLLNSLLDRFTDLAKENIFIKEICANAFTEHGMSLCKTLGMQFVCKHKDIGNVFMQSFYPLPDLEIFKDYPELVTLYSDRFNSTLIGSSD